MHNGTFCLLEGSGLIPPETNCTFSKEKKFLNRSCICTVSCHITDFHSFDKLSKKAKWDTGIFWTRKIEAWVRKTERDGVIFEKIFLWNIPQLIVHKNNNSLLVIIGHSFVDIISIIFSSTWSVQVSNGCQWALWNTDAVQCKANIKHEKMFE